jgi:hypothetical protein
MRDLGTAEAPGSNLRNIALVPNAPSTIAAVQPWNSAKAWIFLSRSDRAIPLHGQQRSKSPSKTTQMSVLQAVVRHVWLVFSYLNESIPPVFATIEHPQFFVISPKMYSSLPPGRDVILQISNVSPHARHCLIDEASAPHRVCYPFWSCVCRAVQSPNYQAACVFLRL